MALETGTYISDLVSTNPVSGDPVSQSDDHHRLEKSTVKASFPNISGAMTLTHTQLNLLDSKSVVAADGYQKLPSGVIMQWGQATTNGSGLATFTHPVAFPNACRSLQLTYQNGAISGNLCNSGGFTTTTSLAYVNTAALAPVSGAVVLFFVVGY